HLTGFQQLKPGKQAVNRRRNSGKTPATSRSFTGKLPPLACPRSVYVCLRLSTIKNLFGKTQGNFSRPPYSAYSASSAVKNPQNLRPFPRSHAQPHAIST